MTDATTRTPAPAQTRTSTTGKPFIPNGDYGVRLRIKDMVFNPAKGTSVANIETTVEVVQVLFGSTAEPEKADLLAAGSQMCERTALPPEKAFQK